MQRVLSNQVNTCWKVKRQKAEAIYAKAPDHNTYHMTYQANIRALILVWDFIRSRIRTTKFITCTFSIRYTPLRLKLLWKPEAMHIKAL